MTHCTNGAEFARKAYENSSSLPKVHIGLPVYNGEKYLRGALDSLLAQDYPNFELLISDNASTDSSAEICLAYARRDARIQFHRNETNIGAAKNFNYVFSLSSGKYFMWAAHDDLWHPTYLRKCVAALEQESEVVLCGSEINFIDESGEPLASPELNKLDTCSTKLRERLKAVTDKTNWYAIYGVIRANALRKTRLYLDSFGGDVILLMELLFHGESRMLPEPLFSYRYVSKTAAKQLSEIVGSNPEISEFKPFTQLAKALLEVIDNSCCAADLKFAMRNDLLDNVCGRNVNWASAITLENPPLVRLEPYQRPVEIRALLQPQMSPLELDQLRRAAYPNFFSDMSFGQRTRYKMQRVLDRHVLWRFRSFGGTKP